MVASDKKNERGFLKSLKKPKKPKQSEKKSKQKKIPREVGKTEKN